jgi:hypothetical protein
MKKFVCLLVVLMLCLSMAIPAFAAEDDFVPSIGYKDGPEIIKGEQNGTDVTDCLVVSTIKQATDKDTDITQYERNLLLDVYDKLLKDEMTLPLENDYVIRDLVNVSYKYNDCRTEEAHGNKTEELKAPGNTLTVTFDIGVDKNTKIVVMTYIENPEADASEGTWIPAESVVNNGDGTLTVALEDIGLVAFVTELDSSASTGDAARGQLGLFIGLLIFSAAAIVVMLCLKGKKK